MSERPPFGDATDEAVSALLDDELDDFASAHGTTADDARRALDAWPGFESRRRELEHARAALAGDDVVLDAHARRRLVRTAIDAAPAGGARVSASHRRRAWRPIAIAAAVLVVLGAAGFGLSQLGGGSSTSSKASKATDGVASSATYVGAVGEIANTETLRALVAQQQAGLPVHAQGEFSNPSPAPGTRSRQPASSAPTTTTPAQASAARADATRCARAVAGRDPVTFLATATYQGRPVVVAGVHRGARTVAFVLDRGTCAVVTAASL